MARELKADERGITYAAMAGFNTQAIVVEDPRVNFFADWVRALDPRRLTGVSLSHVRPTPQERAEALRTHLRTVVHKTAAFQAGLWFYYAGDYPQAIGAFEAFRLFFPGREVYHNLAASHHQLALQAYQAWKKDAPGLPFQLSLAIDPMTRASQIYLTGPTRRSPGAPAEPAALFRHHLDEAMASYRKALTYDAAYTPSAINLGCALLMQGVHTAKHGLNPHVSEAVTTLLWALEREPTSAQILNNLGVALLYETRPDEARDHLLRAQMLAPTYAAPLFNLGQMAHTGGREAEARHYWHAYEQLALRPSPGPSAEKQSAESVLGLAVGRLDSDVSQHWGKATQSEFQVDRKTFVVATYPTGIMTLARDGEILMLMVRDGFQGTSGRGIAIGSEARDVLARYGAPSRRLELTHGHTWGYDVQRIAFQLHDGKVISWLVF